LLVGPPGVGKSAFCEQVVLQNLAIDRPIIYVATEYCPSDAEMALKKRGLREVEPGLLNFVDAYNQTVGVSVRDRLDTVRADCSNLSSIDIAISKLSERIGRKGVLLVFDSLTSPYMFSGSEILRFITQTLSSYAAKGNAVLACVDEGCSKSEDLVTMMSLSNGVIRMEIVEDKRFLKVVKHPTLRPTVVEVPSEPERIGLFEYSAMRFDPASMRQFAKSHLGGEPMRREVGDFVNLFWPNFAHWSCMLWDPKGFPRMIYELNRQEGSLIADPELQQYFPWYMRLLLRFLLPKDLSEVKNMKKLVTQYAGEASNERSGIMEYLEDASKTDEHYVRLYESSDCWGFDNIGATIASRFPPEMAGSCKGCEKEEREWNAVETKCIGLGDPYCEFKLVPGEIDELKGSLEKDASVVERIHERLMQRLIAFLLERKPLVERPRLGSDVHIHVAFHAMGFPHLAGERYRMAQRMGGARAGKEVGERLMDAGIGEDEALNRVINFLQHCKVGKVSMDETIRIRENVEILRTKLFATKIKEPCCYFTTGFLNGLFSAVRNQHVKEAKCAVAGDPYCEWEFR